MSSTVDSRVVQIQFDNKEFERNVQQTLRSLELLNEAVNSINTSKGLGSLTDGMKTNELDSISSGIDSINDRLTNTGIIGMEVMRRITDAGINMAIKVGDKINSVGRQISQGGFVRAQNIEQAKFLLEGLHANVEAIMQDVNYAVEGTSYGLDEAAKASAVFFAAGVKDGDKMKTALRAISGVAAMSGQSYSQMAEVFQDAASKGSFMTQELRRIQLQGIAADQYLRKFFDGVNDGSIKASKSVTESVKEITNGNKTSAEDLEKMLRDGVITFEVFAEAMDNAFGEHATKANETFSGSLANMKTSLSRLGEAFITPGMQAAIPLFNAIRLGISRFTTALKESTGTVSKFSGLIQFIGTDLSRSINNFTHMGGFKVMAKIVHESFRIILKAFESIQTAFKEVFPEATSKNLIKVLENVLNGIVKLREAAEDSDGLSTLTNVMITLFSVLKIVGNALSIVFRIVRTGLTLIATPLNFLTSVLANVSSALSNSFGKAGSGKVFNKLADMISKATEKIASGVDWLISCFKQLFDGIGGYLSNIRSINEALGLVGLAFAAMFAEKKYWWIHDWFKRITVFIEKGIGGVFKLLDPTKINDIFSQLTNSLRGFQRQVYAKAIKDIALALLILAIALKILASINIEDLCKGLAALSIMLFEIIEVLFFLVNALAKSNIASSVKGIWALGSVTNSLIKIGVAMILMASALKILASMNMEELARGLGAMTLMLAALLGFVLAINKYGSRQTGDKLSGVAMTLLGISVALNIMAKAVKELSSMGVFELAKGLGSIVVLLAAIMGFIIGISKLSSGGSVGMVAAGLGMIAIAAALNILTPVLQKLGSMDLISLGKGLGAIIVAMGAMAIASNFISAGGSAGLLAMAIGLNVLSGAIERLGKMDIKQLALGLGTLVVSIAALGLLSAVLAPVIPAMLGIAAAMLALSVAIAILGAGLIMIGAGLASIAGGIMSFASVSQTAVLMFANTIQTLIGAIIDMLPQIAVKFAESLVTFLESIAELAPRFKDAFTSIIATVLEIIEENAPKIINTGFNLIIDLLTGLEQAIPKIAKKAVGVITAFINGISDNMAKITAAGYDLIIEFINGLAIGIEGKGEELRAAIGNLCLAILEEFKGFFGINSPSTVMEEQGRYLMQGLLAGIKGIKGIASAMAKGVKSGIDAIKHKASEFKSKGGELIRKVTEGIQDKASDIKAKVGDAVSRAKDKIGEYAGKFKSAGTSAAEGIASGIRRGASSVISAAGSIANQALRRFKSILGISSPSKVFAETAKWIPEGVVVGIKKTSSNVEKAMSFLADKTLYPISEAVAKIEDLMDINGDINPTITPVLDLSDIESKAGSIGRILGGNSLDLAYNTAANTQTNSQNSYLMDKLISKLDKLTDERSNNSMTNYISVDGTENPEAFAERLMRGLEMRTRAM